MKLMIASDIHGSTYYCKKLIDAYKREKPNKLLLLGDILYHGPRNDLPKEYEPKKVIELLNDIASDIVCVRGNCDTEVDQMVLDFPILSDYALFYIDGQMIFATHGHHFNKDNPSKLSKGEVLLNGHTHIPAFERIADYIYVNPGSVSIPKENSKNSYLIYENGTFVFKALDGEVYMNKEI